MEKLQRLDNWNLPLKNYFLPSSTTFSAFSASQEADLYKWHRIAHRHSGLPSDLPKGFTHWRLEEEENEVTVFLFLPPPYWMVASCLGSSAKSHSAFTVSLSHHSSLFCPFRPHRWQPLLLLAPRIQVISLAQAHVCQWLFWISYQCHHFLAWTLTDLYRFLFKII